MPTGPIQTAIADPGWVSVTIAGLALASAWVWRQVAWGQRLARIEQHQCDDRSAFDAHVKAEAELQREMRQDLRAIRDAIAPMTFNKAGP